MSNQSEAKPLWQRWPVVKLLLIALAAELGFAVLNISVMPIYLADDRHFSGKLIAAVLVAFLLSEAIFKPFAGHLSDKYGRRLFLVIAPLLVAVTPMLSLLVPSRWGDVEVIAFVGLRIVDGVAAAMLWPAAYSAVGASVPPKERASAMSLLNVCFMVGLAFGPWVGGEINTRFGSRAPSFFLASALFLATAVVAFLFASQDSRKARLAQGEELEEHKLSDLWLCAKRIPFVLAMTFVVFVGVGFPLAIVKLFASNVYGMSEADFGRLILPAALAMAIFGVSIGKLGTRLGGKKAVQVGLLLCSIGLWIIAGGVWFESLRTLLVLAGAGVLVGVGFLLAIPSWQASVAHIDPKRSGSYLASVMTVQGIGAIVGTSIGGALYDAGRFFPVIGCAVAVSLGVAMAPFAVPEYHEDEEPGERSQTETNTSDEE